MRLQFQLPDKFVQNVLGVCGQAGENWLEGLPDTIRQLEHVWRIAVDDPFEDLSYNFVAPAVDKCGEPLVIKIGLPSEDDEIYSEASYLHLKNGDGTIRLLAEHREFRALLIERAVPGESVKTLFHERREHSIDVMIGLLKRLTARPFPKQGFIDLHQWTAKLECVGDCPEFPRESAARAIAAFSGSDKQKKVLLHGDLHHTNILSHGESFVAIDPKGVIGDIKYDIGVFLNNHYGWIKHLPEAERQMADAVDRFAARFGESPEAIREWAFAQKVLAAYWTMTENDPRWKAQLTAADIWNI
jgi:streptomycin 6-kinase